MCRAARVLAAAKTATKGTRAKMVMKVMGLGGAAQASLPHPEKGHIWQGVASTAPTSMASGFVVLSRRERGGDGQPVRSWTGTLTSSIRCLWFSRASDSRGLDPSNC